MITRDILDKNGIKYIQKSFFSIYIYLNDDFCGGESYYWKLDNNSNKYNFMVKPKKGECVILHQSINHKDYHTLDNTKYILRLDIIYQKQDCILTHSNFKQYVGVWK